jgi:hypothetical protein
MAGGIIEINLMALTQYGKTRETGNHSEHSQHGSIRTMPQSRRIPAALWSYGNWPRWSYCQHGNARPFPGWRMPDTAKPSQSMNTLTHCATLPGLHW